MSRLEKSWLSPPWRVKALTLGTLAAVIALAFVSVGVLGALPAQAQNGPEKRIAFVIGNAAYKAGALATTANDAGLIAQTLQAAGFDVIGARDLDHNGLSDAMRDFLSKVSAAGPDTTVFVYLAGYGLQYQGDNYFLPVDADIANATDLPIQALRVSDFTRSLASMQNHGSIVVLDAARSYPFPQSASQSGAPELAGGLALVDPDANQLIAFNAAPGTVAPQEAGPYGSYAHGLAEMIRAGGLPLGDVFDRTRLRVSDLTKGAEIAWDASKFTAPFTFLDRAADAPAPVAESDAAIRSKPIREFDEKDAYFAALDRDTLSGYEDFLAAYPNDAMARRVRAIVAARREAITWRETWRADTPEAYWSYLRRYPHGPHVWDARRRLGHFEAALEPPQSFAVISYDVPPPPPPEVVYVDRPVVYFGDPDFGYAPPPPVVFLAPPPPEFVTLPPPPPPTEVYVLPEPVFVPVPVWVEPPRNVAPPRNNIIFNDIHKTIINNVTVENTTINEPQPAAQTPGVLSNLTTGQKLVGAAVIGAAGAAALHVALPPSVQKKALQSSGKAVAPAPAASGAAATSVKPVTGNAAAQSLPAGNALPQAGKLPTTPDTKAAPQPGATEANKPGAGQPAQQTAKPDAHTLPGSNGKPLPPATTDTAKPAVGAPDQQTAKPDAHTLPASNGKPLPPATADTAKAAVGAPAQQTAKPDANKLTGLNGKPLQTNAPPPKSAQKQSTKAPAAPPMTANVKPPRQQLKPPSLAARTPVQQQVTTVKHAPPAVSQPRVMAAPKAPTPKVQLQPRPQQQVQVKAPPQAKAPPAAAPAKPQDKKKKPQCGGPNQPACH